MSGENEADEAEAPTPCPPRTWYHKFWCACRTHASFVGPGILASVAYFDPGNWATDLAAGSSFGYSLLFVVLAAGLGAIVFQVLSCRLGIVTGKDLAQHLRLRFHSSAKNTLFWRWGVLYPLYALSEIAIVATDIAELLGSAIALNLLFPKLPLYAGVLLTAADVLLILAAYRPNGGQRSMRIFELVISCLVLAVFISFIILLFRIQPNWTKVFKGYVPSKMILKPDALYTSIGIIGATVMPHALFLGSRLSTIDRLTPTPSPSASSSTTTFSVGGDFTQHSLSHRLKRVLAQLSSKEVSDKADVEWGSHGVAWMRTHLAHATADIVLSLICFAITINSAILIVAAASFYYSIGGGSAQVGDLFDAYALIKEYVSKGSAFLFAFALLCAGQSASITATLAGQVVSEGFLNWTISPFARRLITRLIGIVPSAVISVALGRAGIDTLLVASQVVLSIVLPFVIFPLVFLTSRRSGVMKVKTRRNGVELAKKSKVTDQDGECSPPTVPAIPHPSSPSCSPKLPSPASPPLTSPRPLHPAGSATPRLTPDEIEEVDFSSPWYITVLGYTLFSVMVVANTYVIVQLARGQ